MNILELRKISKHFPSHKAVTEVSLEIPRGEFFSLLGPSGCGKTTLLRIVAGLDRDFDGNVAFPAHGTLALVPDAHSFAVQLVSFPKMSSGWIRVMRQNQSIIRRDACVLSSACDVCR